MKYTKKKSIKDVCPSKALRPPKGKSFKAAYKIREIKWLCVNSAVCVKSQFFD